MSENKRGDRFFKVKNVLVCKKFEHDGRLAMLMLDKKNCRFVVEPYYFDMFFRNSDWDIEEIDAVAFREAVIKQCGFFPSLTF
ncbi:MAG: hypothetical protein ACJATI_002920 [Halioglobus sp.]|jgi:hypothetical protein